MGVPRRPEWPDWPILTQNWVSGSPDLGSRPPIEGLGGPDPRSGASDLAKMAKFGVPKTDFPSGGPNFGLQRRPKRR